MGDDTVVRLTETSACCQPIDSVHEATGLAATISIHISADMQ